MFSIASVHHKTDRPLHQAATMIRALSQGKTDAEQFALGASLPPWQIIADTVAFKHHNQGPTLEHTHFMTLPVALVRAGELHLLRGLFSRHDFFSARPELPRVTGLDHSGDSLALSCALEALAWGRLDILQALRDQAIKITSAGSTNAQGVDSRSAMELTELREDTCQSLLTALAYAQGLSADKVHECAQWTRFATSKDVSSAQFAQLWLSVSCLCGNSAGISSALKLGAAPERSHVVASAKHGALEMATLMAPKVSHVELRQSPRREWPHEQGLLPTSVAKQFFSSLLFSLEYISKGLHAWHDNHDTTWRESTWADFIDYRDHLHNAILMTLSGKFDTAADSREELDTSKDALASIGRAFACYDAKDHDDSRLVAIMQARPEAPVKANELLFLAQVGSPLLTPMLDASSVQEASTFSAMLFEHHKKSHDMMEKHKAQTQSSNPKRVAHHTQEARAHDHLLGALYLISSRESSLLNSQARSALANILVQFGLTADFERRALEAVSASCSKKRGPLKV